MGGMDRQLQEHLNAREGRGCLSHLSVSLSHHRGWHVASTLIPMQSASPPLPLDQLREELHQLETGSAAGLTDVELDAKIRSLHDGFHIVTPVLPAGTAFYRAVRVTERPSRKELVGYKPAHLVNLQGRCNRIGQAIFYGAGHLYTGFMECGFDVGQFFAVSGWLTNQDMSLNHLGYSEETFRANNQMRDLPFFSSTAGETEANRLVREWQARVFTQQVPRGQSELYRLPIALTEFALSKVLEPNPNKPQRFSGIMYPSVALHLFSDNVAILPSEVDAKMDLFEVILLTLDRISEIPGGGGAETHRCVKPYDYARADAHGNLIWGQKSQIVLAEGIDASQTTPQLLASE
jgi:hypothetical protein